MNTLADRWLAVATGGSAAWRNARTGSRRQALMQRAIRHGPSVLAMLAVSGALLTFERVVNAGVRQGEARRLDAAAHAEALWRCNVIANRSQRNSCRTLLSVARTDPAGPEVSVVIPPVERLLR